MNDAIFPVVDLDKLAKSTGIIVMHSLSIPKGLK